MPRLPTHALLLPLLLMFSLPAFALEPFTANYRAYYKGKPAGDAQMKVEHTGGGFWKIELGLKGRVGLAKLVGLNIEQNTVFTEDNGQFRPLAQSTLRHALLRDKRMNATYDWETMQVRWDGDLKVKQGPRTSNDTIPLQEGDLSLLLLNLAVMRDSAPGKLLAYRVVDGGRIREYHYAAAAEDEMIDVEELRYEALRVDRTNSTSSEMSFWITSGVPTPIRILQRRDGKDYVDLRLVDYQGEQ